MDGTNSRTVEQVAKKEAQILAVNVFLLLIYFVRFPWSRDLLIVSEANTPMVN